MATQQDVGNSILIGQLKVANMVLANGNAREGGFKSPFSWEYIKRFQRALNVILRQYTLGDYISAGFITAYDCLLNFIGVDTDNPVSPYAQNPNATIIINPPYTPLPPLIRNQDNLVDAGGGVWYLPFVDDDGDPIGNNIVPSVVTTNGVSFFSTFDDTQVPSRLYGFTGNYAQVIIVYLNQ